MKLASLAVCSLLALAACGAEGSTRGGSGEEIRIGFAVSTLDNPFFLEMKAGIEKAAADLGASVIVLNAGNDADAQVKQVRTLAEQGVRAIVINPVDSVRSAPAVNVAKTALIPLVTVDRTIGGDEVASEVASDNVQGGALAAIALGRAATGDVVHLRGVQGTSASADRGTGFEQGLNSGAIKVAVRQTADFNRDRAQTVMTSLLRTNNRIKGVFAENDEMALGAIAALGGRAGKDVYVVGFDGTREAIAAIEAGTMAATVAQQPDLLGRKAIEQAVKAAHGERIQRVVDVPVKVVTKDNVAEFKK
ncbi:substrate-binding domain-containing protein [Lentzea nigeriaca]|uniref:substrate-binding domain-containing protein n=1 Tax=Lentzea nigeriaca TaxID=1128665 RepID=UPI00195A9ECF|nr:substrate-binding domain-containing protein [Lentzea nigeriaca]MBM7857152.1 ABC-type sugar transport system substrate-binding protein [Lentzea nigeriaca]